MTALTAIVIAALCLAVAMTAAWRVAVATGQSGWIDAIWTFSVGAAAVFLALVPLADATAYWPRQLLVAGLAAAWSLRLGFHIVARTSRGGDDPRYAQLRDEWGATWRARLLMFLQIQAVCALLLAVSGMAAARNPYPELLWTDFLGAAIVLAAIAGEGLADRQLARFAAEPSNKGKVCDVGLWSWSRHPNYFFEWLGWLAYPVIALDLSGGYWWGAAALMAPALMYWLLVHASGIPPLEAHMLRSRGDAYRAYQARVNAFWPAPPGHRGESA